MNFRFYKWLGFVVGGYQCVLALAIVSFGNVQPARAAGNAEHVVLLVWDGMRPDFISAQYTPQLNMLVENGVFFKNHHSIYISSTEVNGTALATGVFPNRSGIVANSEYRPEIGWASPNATEGIEMIRRGDLATGGKYIRVPTMCEIVQAAGFPTAVAGVKPVALMHDRLQRKSSGASKESIVLYAGKIMPSALEEAITRVNDHKKFPTNSSVPNAAREDWTAKALKEVVWKKNIPKLSVVWLSEPDNSQHDSAPGSDNAISALDVADRRLTAIVKILEEKKVLDKTDIMVVSDHGFSTIARGFELVDILKRAGFKAAKKFDDAEPGDVMVVGLGGSAFLYVIDRKEDVVRRLVSFLQNSDMAGVIFSQVGKGHVEGTFPLSAVRMDAGEDTPDIVFSFKWTDQKNDYDVPGMVYSEGGKRGKGTHASLSRFDMHNTLVAFGPSFKRGMISELPSSNADVAPTILSILGIKPPEPMDGRVLSEALIDGKAPSGKPKTEITKASRTVGLRHWEQYLKTTTFGGAFYVDEGNGTSTLRQP